LSHIPGQRYCSRVQCQNARRQKWRKQKLAIDKDYKANQKDAQGVGVRKILIIGISIVQPTRNMFRGTGSFKGFEIGGAKLRSMHLIRAA
jgi:hypothetical protein